MSHSGPVRLQDGCTLAGGRASPGGRWSPVGSTRQRSGLAQGRPRRAAHNGRRPPRGLHPCPRCPCSRPQPASTRPRLALAQVQTIYKQQHRAPARRAAALRGRGRHRPRARLLSLRTGGHQHRGARRLAPELWLRGRPGTYETTLTRPDLFASYYAEQFRLLLKNHGVSLEVGTSSSPMPVHFSLAENDHLEGSMPAGAAPAAARPVRPAGPGRDGRRHRQRHARDQARRSPAAGAVHRTPRGLLAAPPAPLHGHGARALPELRALHQLPVLHRRVHQAGPQR
jgi:hypothetical protein